MSWQLAKETSPTESQINRWAAIMWLLRSIDSTNGTWQKIPTTPVEAVELARKTSNAATLDEKSNFARDFAAEGLAVEFPKTFTRSILYYLAGTSTAFRDSSTPQPVQARRAERLVLALDRLTLALPDPKAAESLRAPLKKLFADVQSLPDFNPATFADHLAEFQKALPAQP